MSRDRTNAPAAPDRDRATVLVGMSLTEADRRAELLGAAAPLGATTAFLQQGDPSLSAELTRLADAGTETVVLIGIRLGASGPGHSWLRRIAAHWWRERVGHRPALLVATRLAAAADAVTVAAEVKPITGAEPGLTSAAWNEVPGHRHQVLVCRGPRCTAKGADETLAALVRRLTEHGLGDDDVLVTQTGCQFPCNQAPVVSVQPDDVWYGRVDAAAAVTILSEHLIGGRPVTAHRLPRHRSDRTGGAEEG
ncbi:(2Fe-2S) ferredoxin domain-containing protein [Streptomyces nodosus]|uniref:(2Fe-2S) ferredoxin domain-containing protein n=2 Tax=Streptomyces nodosus TaxID=40318 RepID=A0A5P2VYA0_9ACTN|nr:(2Fe-2S) ferredoxin domain-containing protein [Streptomyces nodosus]MBB4789875.1 (2Fe-2S) ferredoxin [Streptomyces nodosus]QEV37611.1 (2Fe-2S) ferredoxin domain-containing protein [Streptomyces nodosus]